MRYGFTFLCLCLGYFTLQGQYTFLRTDTTPVIQGNAPLAKPWAGGMNFMQFSEIDFDQDGKLDLFVFDRHSNRAGAFINTGNPNQTAYRYEAGYVYLLPPIRNWALMRDYNADGKADLFTSANGSAAVYLNISTPQTGLKFKLVKPIILSNYGTSLLNAYISPADIPGIEDVDGDGDMDILSFSNVGSCIDYHQNQSIQQYGVPDSLVFVLKTDNWGNFVENVNNNSVTLNDSCDGPQSPIAPEDLSKSVNLGYVFNRPEDSTTYGPVRHAGSTIALLDYENDNALDIFLGDIAYSNIVKLHNGGTAQTANMDDIDLYFPENSDGIDIQLFPGGFFVDLNNDGKKDFLASSNAAVNGANFNCVQQLLNTGQGQANLFENQGYGFLQMDMIDVGENALPTFFDYNNDGLKDLVIANYGYYQNGGIYKTGLALYKNVGTPTAPQFKLLTRDWCGLSAANINYMVPTFGDLDSDGKPDLVCGNRTGELHYFKNVATTADTAVFQLVANAFGTTDVGGYSAPALFDFNIDGLLDLLVGEKNNNLNYFQNQGTPTNFAFTTTPTNANVGDINQADNTLSTFVYGTPVVIDSANTTQVLVGSLRGWVYAYNVPTNVQDAWVLTDSVFAGHSNLGFYSAPAVADLNADGFIDLVVGNLAGGLDFYSGADPLTANVMEFTKNTNVEVYPNPATSQLNISISGNYTAPLNVTIYTPTGQLAKQTQLTGLATTVDVTALTNGLYVIKLESNNYMEFFKIVIHK